MSMTNVHRESRRCATSAISYTMLRSHFATTVLPLRPSSPPTSRWSATAPRRGPVRWRAARGAPPTGRPRSAAPGPCAERGSAPRQLRPGLRGPSRRAPPVCPGRAAVAGAPWVLRELPEDITWCRVPGASHRGPRGLAVTPYRNMTCRATSPLTQVPLFFCSRHGGSLPPRTEKLTLEKADRFGSPPPQRQSQ